MNAPFTAGKDVFPSNIGEYFVLSESVLYSSFITKSRLLVFIEFTTYPYLSATEKYERGISPPLLCYYKSNLT